MESKSEQINQEISKFWENNRCVLNGKKKEVYYRIYEHDKKKIEKLFLELHEATLRENL
jgi:hypothetical protein